MFALFLLLRFQNANAQWVNRYNGQGDFSDRFNAILSDASGNVYLAGSTVQTGDDQDILVVKLNPNGDTLWTNRYNGPAGGLDAALAMEIGRAHV